MFFLKLRPLLTTLFLIIFSYLTLQGQPDTLVIRPGFSQLPANNYFTYFNTDQSIAADSAWKTLQTKSTYAKKLNKINFGSINGFYWLATTLKNQLGKDQHLILEIRQPHLYRMVLYKVEKDSIHTVSETGIHYNFYQRPTASRFFDFPMVLKEGETTTVLIMVHHLNSLSLPIYLMTESTFHQRNYNQNIIWGYWFGFLSFCALFALIAAILLRNSIFIWYFFYISTASLYGFTEQGYAFQFFFPGQADVAATVIIQLAVYGFIFLIKLSQGLLDTKKYLPTIHRILNAMFYFVLSLIVAAYIVPQLMFRLSPIVLPIANLVVLIGLVLLAYSGIKALFTNRIIALFYLTAYGTLVAASIFGILNYGFGFFQYDGPSLTLMAYFFEAMLLSVALVILFRQVQGERTRLAKQLTDQQKQMYQHYINGIEKERSRIAGELHDDVGSRLSHLKRLLQSHSEESLKTAEQVEQLIKDVRQLSHDLSPPLAHIAGLQPLLENLIADTRHSSKIDIRLQAHDFNEGLTSTQIQQIYRVVQEAFNNIVKHAEASRIDIQIFGHTSEVDIIIEDNGKGFDSKSKPDGFGLNQMRIRTESIGGRIEINSHPGGGCHILIQIPYGATSIH